MTVLHMKNKIKLVGFTLIELLLVVAIASILVSLGLSMMKQRSQEAKIEKTVLQIQQLLQAGMAYYIDNGCWPGWAGTFYATECTLNSSPPPFSQYIPAAITVNPWGKPYRYGMPYDPMPASNRMNIFQVLVDTPNENIAKRIAELLPNATARPAVDPADIAICGSSNCGILTQVNIPAQFFAKDYVKPKFTLVAVGNATMTGSPLTDGTTQTLPNFTCPSGSKDAAATVSIRETSYNENTRRNGTGKYPASFIKDISLSANKISASCPADANGFITNCQMQVTLNYGHGVMCAVENALLSTTNGKKNIDCRYYPLAGGEHPNLIDIIYQYQIYCCSTTPCY
jgi:prepilin-type N-terminal cleavage/methylation domain-containing protein